MRAPDPLRWSRPKRASRLLALALFIAVPGVLHACGGTSGSAAPNTYSDQPSAIAACDRYCDRGEACLPGSGDSCKKNCLSSITPAACTTDDEVAQSYDNCDSCAGCPESTYKTALAHCRGRNDAGPGLYCDPRGSGSSPTGCSYSSTCEGSQYLLSCDATTCTCSNAGQTTKTFAPDASTCAVSDGGALGAGFGAGSPWQVECGFP